MKDNKVGPGTWIPENQRDTRWWIFFKLFQCRIPNIKTMSLDYVKQFGMPTCGDPILDKETANELVIRMLSIAQMVDFFNQGVTILLVKYTDAKIIYEYISNHLQFWKLQLESGFHVRNAPIEDLVAMDKFAVTVYAHAKYQFTTDMVDSIIARRMSTTMRVTRDRILRKKPQVVTINEVTKEEETNQFPQRESMAEVFAQRMPTGNKIRWK